MASVPAASTATAATSPGAPKGFVIDLGPDEEPLPDLNRLYSECDWDPKQQRMVRRTT
ncbi:hypothetical protein ACFY20_42445 [Streptomyces sp. NPDC001312]|uniref:hypothetical protein n=1 Tax=Streptomyces sp. NPDC001312 TaxID=3364561 RepID=UPI00369FDB98